MFYNNCEFNAAFGRADFDAFPTKLVCDHTLSLNAGVMWGQRLIHLRRRDHSGFRNSPSDLDHAGFPLPNSAPHHSQLERCVGQSHSLIRAATPRGAGAVASCLNQCISLINKMDRN